MPSRSLLIAAVCLGVLGLPALAAAAGGGHPAVGPVLFGVGLLTVAARLGGLLVERIGLPSVLGELLTGILLGNLLPSFLARHGIDFVRADPTIQVLAEVGVLILLFEVGLETDLRALVRVGPSAVLVALIGIVVPIGLGWGAAAWLQPQAPRLAHIFVGATLTATSVGITVRVLKDLDATQTKEGHTVLGAAILDDVLGLVVLAVLGGAVSAAATGGPGLSALAVAGILVKAVLFLAVTVGLGIWLSRPIVQLVARADRPGFFLAVGLALCFALAHVAELMGLAGIVGAFAAGVLLDPYGENLRARASEEPLRELLHPLAGLFVPLFFVLMGIRVDLTTLGEPSVLTLGLALIACAIAGKLACGLGVLDRDVRRLVVGIGMIPRGEVGLIFAGIGATLTLQGAPLLSQGAFSAVVLMVLATTIAAPIGLRWALRSR